jgi:L,D-transpeptidase ErfK/SrfK
MPSWRGKTTWRTPLGKFKITGKRQDPVWRVPPSIAKKMAIEGKSVEEVVPPGPDNPLGRYAIDTTIPSIVIHETIWPTSIYQFRSHGCVRVHPDNMEWFFKMIKVNTSGELIYNPVKVAVMGNNKIFLEVHKDIYGYSKNLFENAKQLIEVRGLVSLVNWDKVEIAVREKAGIPEDIAL